MAHVIGTAGHIDHGKTALIRVLTGQDTDRLKEEKERGISIDLGFAYMDLSSGERVGVVDVPGHERFIRNMLAGAHGIDMALLVVAADDGVMPQTEEHLDIVHLLGITHGVVAITKVDLVDEARVREVQEDVEILLAGTALEGAPVVAVSSTTGAGIETLRQVIEQQFRTYRREPPPGYFRLPVDRAFVMHGHGTVVTGTALAGTVHVGDVVRVLPGGDEVRVRSVQVHGQEARSAGCGQRVALNLAGLERNDIGRGHVVCDPRLDRVTDRLDARVEVRPAAGRPVKSHETVRLYVGTAEALGKLVWLTGRTEVAPRQAAFAQLVLREPIHVLRGDRFILRDASAQRTIAGGTVVHPFAQRHRRRDTLEPPLTALWQARTASGVVSSLLQLEPDFAVALSYLAQAAGLPAADVRDVVRADGNLRALPDVATAVACTTGEKWARLKRAAVAQLTEFHHQAPLAPGMEMESLRSQLAPELSPKLFRAVLDGLVAEHLLVREDSTLRLPTHRVVLRQDEHELGARAEAQLAAAGFTPPALKQMEDALRVPRQRLVAILQQLEREGRVARIGEGMYFARAPLDRARELLRSHVERHGEITAASFRDLLGASRKFSIALLDYFDRTGFTLRVGDLRKLRR
jgi:selenocysteine-specific elongation factor